MSSFSTFSPSFEQTYCCFRRAPSFLCSQLNEIAADDSPAENILIGTETSPKEIVAEPMECAGIGPADRERVTARDCLRILLPARGRVHPAPAARIATRRAFGLQWTTTVTPKPPPPSDDALKTYRAKRSADRTPEPSGSVAAAPGRRSSFPRLPPPRPHSVLGPELTAWRKRWPVPKGRRRTPPTNAPPSNATP